ncbi:MAG: hypothetical protein HY040_18425 [Planctomycetes bacterium]|nr:hypothetical protein [Planctomycetota bacterium]
MVNSTLAYNAQRSIGALLTAALACVVVAWPNQAIPSGGREDGAKAKSQATAGDLVAGEPHDLAAREKLFPLIDKRALAATPEAEASVDSLAAYLAKPAKNDLDKVRAIYRWITDRIAYDVDGFLAKNLGDNTVAGVLKNRKCVCEGYARIFVALCKEAGVEAVQIRGHARGAGYSKDNADSILTHSWNAFKLSEKWYLVDPTWGAGTVQDKKFKKMFREYYFEVDSDQLLFTHFPIEDKWQLQSKPLSRQEFEKRPRFSSEFFNLGFPVAQVKKALLADDFKEPVKIYSIQSKKTQVKEAPISRTLKEGKRYTFRIQSNDYQFMALINNGKFTFLERRNNQFEGYCVPTRGTLKIGGNYQASKAGQFEGIMEYVVE